jgi:hypothetical protein
VAICITTNVVCFGGGCFCQTPTGIEFTGDQVLANQYIDCSKVPVQGTVSGYISGGDAPTPTGGPTLHSIEKFSFTSDANATDVGELSVCRSNLAGQSSTVSGYSSGGGNPSGFGSDIIDKFPFASDSNATDVGNLSNVKRTKVAGQSSDNHGYTSGGDLENPSNGQPTLCDVIDKFPFASDGNATDVGNLTDTMREMAGTSSCVSGYNSGGSRAPGPQAAIDKFPFASDSNATGVGNLSQGRKGASGQASAVSGYVSGGQGPPGTVDKIDKFPFAADANATDVAELATSTAFASGTSSGESGYASGGESACSRIEKFTFATDSNASCIADLVEVRSRAAGQQV